MNDMPWYVCDVVGQECEYELQPGQQADHTHDNGANGRSVPERHRIQPVIAAEDDTKRAENNAGE